MMLELVVLALALGAHLISGAGITTSDANKLGCIQVGVHPDDVAQWNSANADGTLFHVTFGVFIPLLAVMADFGACRGCTPWDGSGGCACACAELNLGRKWSPAGLDHLHHLLEFANLDEVVALNEAALVPGSAAAAAPSTAVRALLRRCDLFADLALPTTEGRDPAALSYFSMCEREGAFAKARHLLTGLTARPGQWGETSATPHALVPGGKALFVLRKCKNKGRHAHNFQCYVETSEKYGAIVGGLEAGGFTVAASFMDGSVQDLARSLAAASVVVVPHHAAAIAYVFFVRPGTLVAELTPYGGVGARSGWYGLETRLNDIHQAPVGLLKVCRALSVSGVATRHWPVPAQVGAAQGGASRWGAAQAGATQGESGSPRNGTTVTSVSAAPVTAATAAGAASECALWSCYPAATFVRLLLAEQRCLHEEVRRELGLPRPPPEATASMAASSDGEPPPDASACPKRFGAYKTPPPSPLVVPRSSLAGAARGGKHDLRFKLYEKAPGSSDASLLTPRHTAQGAGNSSCDEFELHGDPRCRPTFLLIGAQKSGTSTVAMLMAQHPQVRASPPNAPPPKKRVVGSVGSAAFAVRKESKLLSIHVISVLHPRCELPRKRSCSSGTTATCATAALTACPSATPPRRSSPRTSAASRASRHSSTPARGSLRGNGRRVICRARAAPGA